MPKQILGDDPFSAQSSQVNINNIASSPKKSTPNDTHRGEKKPTTKGKSTSKRDSVKKETKRPKRIVARSSSQASSAQKASSSTKRPLRDATSRSSSKSKKTISHTNQAGQSPEQKAQRHQPASDLPGQRVASVPGADFPRDQTISPQRENAAHVPGHHKSAPLAANIQDGRAARRAASATSLLNDFPQTGTANHSYSNAAQGLDKKDERHPHGGSLTNEFRKIEQHFLQKIRGETQLEPRRQTSLLDKIGKLMNADTYRQWLSTFKMRHRSEIVDDFGLDPLYAERWRPFFNFLYQSYWRVETVGMENIPDIGRALIVANHSGTLPYDGAMLMYTIRYGHPAHRDIRPLVEDFVFHFPFLGVAMNRIGCVRACQENAERLLGKEQIIAVFPEGIKGISKPFRQRYQLQRFGRGGFIKLALKCKTPIIPAAIIGAEEIFPMLGKVTWLASYLGIPYIPLTPTFPWFGPLGAIPLPTKWTIRFHEPLDFSAQYGPDAHEDRILVNRLSEEVRSTIQSMVDETLATRRSVIFG